MNRLLVLAVLALAAYFVLRPDPAPPPAPGPDPGDRGPTPPVRIDPGRRITDPGGPVTTEEHRLRRGTRLFLHSSSDSPYPKEQQVGAVSYYQAVEDHLWTDFAEYYSRADGTHKFFEKVQLHVYGEERYFPYRAGRATAYALGTGGGRTEIHIVYMSPSQRIPNNAYGYPAALSHEFGHAWDNWAGGTAHPVFRDFWSRQVAPGAAVYQSGVAYTDDSVWGRDSPWEQFANAYRYHGGVHSTRGHSNWLDPVSGQVTDGVIRGFEDPAAHPEWKKLLQMLPELTAYWQTYGVQGSLEWDRPWGAYKFMNGAGRWVMQVGYYEWYEHDGTRWQRIHPTYSRG